jgi:hypothetical protein
VKEISASIAVPVEPVTAPIAAPVPLIDRTVIYIICLALPPKPMHQQHPLPLLSVYGLLSVQRWMDHLFHDFWFICRLDFLSHHSQLRVV